MKAGSLRPIVLLSTALVALSTIAAMLAIPHDREEFAASAALKRVVLAGPGSLKGAEPDAFFRISREAAEQLNQKLPFAIGPNPAAAPFLLPERQAGDFERALHCLTAAVYYEAGSEPIEGQQAVAQVVLNRLRHPAFPKTVCGVVFEGAERATGCQFTFTCDGSMQRAPVAGGWSRAGKVALAALRGAVTARVGWSTHYHADYVLPHWAPTLLKTATVGSHIFYRWNAGWSAPQVFKAVYAGHEPAPGVTGTGASEEEAETAQLDLAGDTAPVDPQVPDPPPPALLEDRKAAVLLADHGLRLGSAVEAANADQVGARRSDPSGSAMCSKAKAARIEPFQPQGRESVKGQPCA